MEYVFDLDGTMYTDEYNYAWAWPRIVDMSGVSYVALVSVAEVSVSKTSGATRLHHECRRCVL